MDVVVQGADVAGLRNTSGQNEGSQIAGWFISWKIHEHPKMKWIWG
jgi:hypothetical protein